MELNEPNYSLSCSHYLEDFCALSWAEEEPSLWLYNEDQLKKQNKKDNNLLILSAKPKYCTTFSQVLYLYNFILSKGF